MSKDSNNEGLDLTGLGKLAKAIPKEVYTRSTETVLSTFEKLVAPITESTSGLGRYIRQKFDSMVMVEKAIATYTLEEAVARARTKTVLLGVRVKPISSKSFVRALEEASKETDPLLHEMWTNLLANQISDGEAHPHFVETLAHFSPAEAQILASLGLESDVGERGEYNFYTSYDTFRWWIKNVADTERKPWGYSCSLLCRFGFTGVFSLPEKEVNDQSLQDLASPVEDEETTAILYRTLLGEAFMKTVSP